MAFISKRNNGFYYLFFVDGAGRRRKVSTGTKVKRKAEEFKGRFQGNGPTLRQFRALYEPYVRSNLAGNTASLHLLFVQQFAEHVGDIPLGEITVLQIEAFKTSLLDGGNRRVTVNMKLAKLRSIFNTAVRWGAVKVNPFLQVKPLAIPEATPAYFTPEQFATFLSFVTNQEFSEFCLVAFYTGMRLSEISALDWSDVDIERKIVLIRSKEGFITKGRRNRIIPLNQSLADILRARKERATGLPGPMFHQADGSRYTKDFVTKKFKRVLNRSGLDSSLHFHSLRHSFCTLLVKSGVSLYQVQKLAGHSRSSVTQIYSHLVAQDLQDAVDLLNLSK